MSAPKINETMPYTCKQTLLYPQPCAKIPFCRSPSAASHSFAKIRVLRIADLHSWRRPPPLLKQSRSLTGYPIFPNPKKTPPINQMPPLKLCAVVFSAKTQNPLSQPPPPSKNSSVPPASVCLSAAEFFLPFRSLPARVCLFLKQKKRPLCWGRTADNDLNRSFYRFFQHHNQRRNKN